MERTSLFKNTVNTKMKEKKSQTPKVNRNREFHAKLIKHSHREKQ